MKLLIIRFSSFGDIVQSMAVPRAFLDVYPDSQVDWLTREDFAELLRQQPTIHRVHSYPRSAGVFGLMKLALGLSQAGYTHVYDAHANLRSSLVMFILRVASVFSFFFGRRVSF